MGVGRLAGGKVRAREQSLRLGEIERAGLGDARALLDGARGEQLAHAGDVEQRMLGRLDVHDGVERSALADGEAQAVQLVVGRARHDDVEIRDVAHSVEAGRRAAGRHEATEIGRRDARVTQSREQRDVGREERDAPRLAREARRDVEPSRGASQASLAHDAAEAPGAVAIAREQHEALAFRAKLDAREGAQPGGLRRVVEAHLSVEPFDVREREGGEAELDGARDEGLDARGAARGVVASDVEWGEHGSYASSMATGRGTGISALEFMPARISLSSLRRAADGCKGCPLYEDATQAVFGEGPRDARVVLVGEQPGNDEDLSGRPFVGPAGRVLDEALAAAGIARGDTYVTNVVKHFKWIPKGKRRLHQKPNAREVSACLPWLEKEIELVKPRIVVCLGATAAQALLGRKFRVTVDRGRLIEEAGAVLAFGAELALGTVHPSSILRQRTSAERHREMALFERDLRVVAKALKTA